MGLLVRGEGGRHHGGLATRPRGQEAASFTPTGPGGASVSSRAHWVRPEDVGAVPAVSRALGGGARAAPLTWDPRHAPPLQAEWLLPGERRFLRQVGEGERRGVGQRGPGPQRKDERERECPVGDPGGPGARGDHVRGAGPRGVWGGESPPHLGGRCRPVPRLPGKDRGLEARLAPGWEIVVPGVGVLGDQTRPGWCPQLRESQGAVRTLPRVWEDPGGVRWGPTEVQQGL